MPVLDHLAQAAAVILLVELFVILFIFLALSGGMAFGLWWLRRKTQPAFSLLNHYLEQGATYVHLAADYAARPIILAGSLSGRIGGTLQTIRRAARHQRTPVAAQAATGLDEEPAPLVYP